MGDAGAVGQAERMRLTKPGRCPEEGASRTPPPTAGCETGVAAYDAAYAVPSRRTKGARAVPAELDTLGCRREMGEPWETPVRLVTPNVCI